MLKTKTILIFICMLIFLAGCTQTYLILNMGIFGFANLFFYVILFFAFILIVITVNKKNWALVIISTLFIFAFISVKLGSNRIEEYYFNNAVSNGSNIKSDIKRYYDIHKGFPESLNILYGKSQIPQYSIGILKYPFRYHKTDSSYTIYFNLFEGKMFRNLGVYDTWTFYD
jgi:hypothetical protein